MLVRFDVVSSVLYWCWLFVLRRQERIGPTISFRRTSLDIGGWRLEVALLSNSCIVVLALLIHRMTYIDRN